MVVSNSIMSDFSSKIETRGRPRKQAHELLPPISRKLFSQHCAVFYACCMVYVLELFLNTKQEKRIGHSEGGFTIYDKLNDSYCFESFEEDIKQWKFASVIMGQRELADFTRTINGCAPKFVFKEIVSLIVQIHNFIRRERIQSVEELQGNLNRFLHQEESHLDIIYKYIRFTFSALKELRMDKWSQEISRRLRELWHPFVRVVAYTIFCVQHRIQKNKYLKPFFSDAQKPEETIIGQLNLKQIVQEEKEKPSVLEGFKKIREEQHYVNLNRPIFDRNEQITQTFRRPITLITFPSNNSIDSPFKSPALRSQFNVKENQEKELEKMALININRQLELEQLQILKQEQQSENMTKKVKRQ